MYGNGGTDGRSDEEKAKCFKTGGASDVSEEARLDVQGGATHERNQVIAEHSEMSRQRWGGGGVRGARRSGVEDRKEAGSSRLT